MEKKQTRRTLIKNLALGASALAITPASALASYKISEVESEKKLKLKGNINHSVSRWTFNYLSLDDLCIAVKKLGFSAIDLVGPKDWPTLQKHGIYIPGTRNLQIKEFIEEIIKDIKNRL